MEQPGSKSPPRLLIVDDEPDLCDLLSFQFSSAGWTVDICKNVVDAFEKVKAEKYDVVLTDVRMPGGSGVQLLERIQGLGKEVPQVVLMSGYTELTPEEALKKGAKALVSKPMKTRELIALVRSLTVGS